MFDRTIVLIIFIYLFIVIAYAVNSEYSPKAHIMFEFLFQCAFNVLVHMSNIKQEISKVTENCRVCLHVTEEWADNVKVF